jgi:drug/metabolite transporter (DMT)-like permease
MASPNPRIPRTVIAGIALAVLLDTVIQITWKLAVAGIPDDASLGATVSGALSGPYFYVAMLAFGAQLINWMRVLARADLSYAQPFTALSYLTVLTLSSHTLHEHLSPARLCGVGMILAGVFLISRTSHRTPDVQRGTRA